MQVCVLGHVPHGKADALAVIFHRKHFYPNHIPHMENLSRMADEFFADLRNMHQSILMDADIHKSPEIRHIPDSAGKLHTHLQVVGGENVRPEKHRGQLVPGITAGLQELRDDILKGGNTCAQLLGSPEPVRL